jgi:outer membrane protein OmpA-like peptidoglycan-associated protein
VRIVNRNQTDSLLELGELSYSLDETEILHLGADSDRIHAPEIPILERALPVGRHTLSAVLELRGKRGAVLKYLSKYKVKVRVRFRFVVDEGKPTEVAVTSYLKDGALLRFEDRPAARYLIARSLATAAGQSDRDKDSVADDADLCPDLAGSTAAHGCPDQDGDGIADKDDRCPKEPETFNGYQDQDGCPDEAPAVAATPAAATPAATSPAEPSPAEPSKAAPEPAPTPELSDRPEHTAEGKSAKNLTALVVYFDFNVDELPPAFARKLDQIAQALREHPEVHRLRIEGHTDYLGSDDYNQALSERRASAVARYLASKSIDAARLETVGFGRTRPRDPGKTAAARAHNRRVEFVIRD